MGLPRLPQAHFRLGHRFPYPCPALAAAAAVAAVAAAAASAAIGFGSGGAAASAAAGAGRRAFAAPHSDPTFQNLGVELEPQRSPPNLPRRNRGICWSTAEPGK